MPKFGQALKWAYIMNWGGQGWTALVTVILASLLGPSSFGVVAIASVYISFIQMFVDQGFVAALIQRPKLQQEHLDSAFWLVLVTSLCLSGISASLSGWWAKLNHIPELALLIPVLSVSICTEGLTVVQKGILQREMNFRTLALRENVSAVMAGALGVGMALRGFGVWALVAQKLLYDFVALGLLWKLSD